MIFELFIFLFGKNKNINEVKNDIDNENIWKSNKEKYKFKFYGFLGYVFSLISQKNSKILKTITAIFNHFGLSHNGVNISQTLGFTISDKTRLREENNNLILYKNNLNNKLNNNTYITWIDNFSKIYFSRSIKKGEIQQNQLWTGETKIVTHFSKDILKIDNNYKFVAYIRHLFIMILNLFKLKYYYYLMKILASTI